MILCSLCENILKTNLKTSNKNLEKRNRIEYNTKSKQSWYDFYSRLCGYGGTGRRAGFRFQWETVQVRFLLSALQRLRYFPEPFLFYGTSKGGGQKSPAKHLFIHLNYIQTSFEGILTLSSCSAA